MEFTREIYWNVDHGLTTLAPMYLLALAAVSVLAYGAFQRIRIYRLGQPLKRTDQPAARLAAMVQNMLLQTRVLPTLFFSGDLWHFLLVRRSSWSRLILPTCFLISSS